jgi:hypothetical protein
VKQRHLSFATQQNRNVAHAIPKPLVAGSSPDQATAEIGGFVDLLPGFKPCGHELREQCPTRLQPVKPRRPVA